MGIYVDVLQSGTNSHGVTVDDLNAFATDFVTDGVVGSITNTAGVAPTTGAFGANAQDTPDNTIAVTSGVAYITGTPTGGVSQKLRVNMDANANVTISANSTGSTVYDWIYIKLDPDKMQNPAVDSSDVATLVACRSTSSSTDNSGTTPAYGHLIAIVTVANGFSSIADASIKDERDAAAVSTSASFVPTGTISAYGGTSAPTGWLMCDGSSVLRSSYAALYAVIGTAFGTADSNHFNVPDLRGKFARGVAHTTANDPDRATRTGSTGGNTGDNVGSLQGYSNYAHVHAVTDPTHGHTMYARYTDDAGHGYLSDIRDNSTGDTYYHTSHDATGISIQSSGGNEARPINVYVEYIIKT